MQNFYESIIKNLKTEAIKLNEKLTKIRENNQDMNMYISNLKSLRETLDLISKYDWKLNYSEYKIKDEEDNLVNQVSVWEQNHDGTIRNHKAWKVIEASSFQIKNGNGKIVMSIDELGNVNW